MPEQSPTDASSQPSDKAAPARRVRWRRFPAIWTILLAAGAGLYQLTDATRDYKTVTLMAAGFALLLGLSLWFAICSGHRRRYRWGAFLVFWAILYAAFSSIDFINDGDNRIIGWRFVWQPKPDQLLSLPVASGTGANQWQPGERDYPGFLGSRYWAEVEGITLDTDWQSNPPEEVWRQTIGAGWSAFAIVGDYAITQEQRGEHELVTCYRVADGEVIWSHADQARFDPKTAGGGLGSLGPRATPTIHDDRVITQGATGIVNCLDARTGQVIWSHDAHHEHGADNLLWGKSGSPLVVGDMVVVNVGAPADPKQRETYNASLVAYDLRTGEIRWTGGYRTTAYASPVAATLAGELQILQINEDYLTSHRASDGQVLWEHEWPGSSSGDASAAQPVPVGNDRLLLTRGYGTGASLLEIARDTSGQYSVEPLWQPPVKTVMKNKFANVLVRDRFVYGLDGILLQCIELETGRSMWRKRRNPPFGHGQIMLIGDVVLILSETGELALVECTPDRYNELASLQVFGEYDVTWNNPAFSAPYLLIRNAREAACYRLPLVE